MRASWTLFTGATTLARSIRARTFPHDLKAAVYASVISSRYPSASCDYLLFLDADVCFTRAGRRRCSGARSAPSPTDPLKTSAQLTA